MSKAAKAKRGVCLLCGVLLLITPIGAQESSPDPASDAQESTEDLLNRSLELDISTSRREELIAWCLVLGLDSSGADETLKSRLRAYYGLDAGNAVSITRSTGGTQVIIEAAKRSEYFKVDIGGGERESVVRLSGDVVLSVKESGRNRSHRVSADSILFNEEHKTISAVGNIEYIVDTDGREERFTGDSLTFKVSDWTGVIFRGTSERSEDVDGQKIDFFFRGESIKRSGTDILVLTDGTITSHDAENPDYALKARKIWITGPGEWGLFSATLYVGHVPVLYLPFYWKSGQDLIFNPVIGFRSRVGYYIQTTLYLLGRKEQDDGFSILGFGDSAGGDYELVRDGLYLVRKPGSSANETSKNVLKYTLDGYSGIGASTALSGSFPDIWENGSLDFHTSLGVSRSVDSSGNPYFLDGSNARMYWNNSFIGSAVLPFRWGAWLELSHKSWSMHLDWYSDRYYSQDFGYRKENFDWLSFLLGEEGDTNEPDSVDSMKWEIVGSHSFDVSEASPWIQSLSLDRFRTALTWSTKENSALTTPAEEQVVNPARDFFYPSQLVLPDLRISMRGALPDYRISRSSQDADPEVAQPFYDSGDPVYIDSFEAIYSADVMEASLGYGLESQLYVEDSPSSTTVGLWNEPADVDLNFGAARINTTHRGNINYGLDFWDGLVGLGGSTQLSGYYQVHADLFGSGEPVSTTTREEDYEYSKFLWDNNLSLYLKPFQGLPSLAETSIEYTFNANLFAYQFLDTATAASPAYGGEWLSGAEDIQRHDTAVSLRWSRGVFSANSSFTADIPPLDERYTVQAGAGFSYKGWSASLSQQNSYDAGVWTVQPLLMTAAWTGWKDEVTLSQSAQVDFENLRLSNLESQLKFWGFETRFSAAYAKTYQWVSYTWVEGPSSFVPTNLQFSYRRTFEPEPLWKNRIKSQTVLDASWNINLSQPTDNVLTFKWTQDFEIYKFLDLRISFSSTNRSMYLYFPWWRDQLGITGSHSFFEDLAKSFNFFNEQDRLDSQFNMDRLDVELVHHLRNWDLSFEYSGWPALSNNKYSWKHEFSIFLKWNPLPMFNQKTSYEDDVWAVESFK